MNQKLILVLALIGLYVSPVMAQNPRPMRPGMGQAAPRSGGAGAGQPGERMQKLESAKIGFLTTRMDLNSKEAEKFWPIYNQYQKEMRELMKQRRDAVQANADVSAKDRLDDQMEMEAKMLDLRKKYTREFERAVSPEKVLELYKAEREFKQKLVQELQNRRNGQN
ncbi:MAG: hypothetical protein ACKOW2_03380 [Sphingobacteriaceae bacterium]